MVKISNIKYYVFIGIYSDIVSSPICTGLIFFPTMGICKRERCIFGADGKKATTFTSKAVCSKCQGEDSMKLAQKALVIKMYFLIIISFSFKRTLHE
jgi:hypothetical protein